MAAQARAFRSGARPEVSPCATSRRFPAGQGRGSTLHSPATVPRITMNLVEWLQRLMTNFGAGWVMWLLIGLSVISVAIMLERGWFYWSLRDDIGKLARGLRERLREEDLEGAQKMLEQSPSA